MQRQRSFGTGRPRCDHLTAPGKLRVLHDSQDAADLELTNTLIHLNNNGIAYMEASNYEESIAFFRRALHQLESPASVSSSSSLPCGQLLPPSSSVSCVSQASSTTKPLLLKPTLQKAAQLFSSSEMTAQTRYPQSREYYIYQRREYDEGMNMYYSPVRMDASTMDAGHDALAAASTIILYNMGQAYLRQDRDEEARGVFEKALDNNRSHYLPGVPTFKILHNLGYIQYRQQDIQGAIRTFCEALHQCQQQSVNRLDIANSLQCLGVLYFHLPEPDAGRSMDCYIRALAIRKELLGPTHTDLATLLNNIGRVHYIEQQYEEALVVYEEALRIRRTLLGHDHLDVAATVYNAGQSYHQQGKLDLALLFYEEFVRITAPKLGPMHRDVAIILKCMAQIYHERENFDQALGLYQQALTAARASLGVHAETASIFNKLGNLYYENQDFDNAIDMYEQGLEVERAVLHSLHPNIVVTLSNLGQIRKQRGEYAEALTVYEEALDIQLKSLGNSHPAVAVTISNIGLINYQTRNYTKALDHYQEALRIRRDAFGENNLEVASCLNSLGLVLFKLGLHDMAMQSFLESLRLRRELLGDTHRDVAIIIYNIATIFLEQGNDNEAMRCYRETLRVERMALGEDHEDVLLTITYIAQVNQNKGDLQAALACYAEILKSQQRSRPDDHEAIAKTLNRMANIHLQNGHPGKVMELMTEATRRIRLAGRSIDELTLSGFHLYGFSRVHPEASAAA